MNLSILTNPKANFIFNINISHTGDCFVTKKSPFFGPAQVDKWFGVHTGIF
jgi:hypothetical protein